MSGFDEAWRADKVLVCSIARTRTLYVWGWFTRARGAATVQSAVEHAAYIRRETGHPAWVEDYGAPAAVPEQRRRFTDGFVKERANGKTE